MAVEISRYGNPDVHTHYRSVINVIAMLRQLTKAIQRQLSYLAKPQQLYEE